MSQIKKILIIDDEGDLLEIIEARLVKAGFEVATAEDGAVGLDKINSFRPDAILLDISMPGIDGWEVCQKIKNNPETKSIRVIILTATRNLKRAKEVAADRVVLKPFNYEELLDVLK